jgi:hypothetical protein
MDQKEKVETLIREECYSDHARRGQAEDRIGRIVAGIRTAAEGFAMEFAGMAGRFLGAQAR